MEQGQVVISHDTSIFSNSGRYVDNVFQLNQIKVKWFSSPKKKTEW